MGSTIEFIDSKNSSAVDDRPYKNKWRWAWLEEIDSTGKKNSFWCRKIKEPGHCFCVLCSRKIKYGSNGKKTLFKHSKDPLHKKCVQSQQHAVTFPGATPVQAKASITDRVAHQKAVVTAFLCENTLPFNLAPKLIELTKNLSSDKLALSKLKMSRTTATYVNTHGTAKCMRRELVQQLKGNFFSLNIDEATNNAMDKILNVMVRFYDDEQKRVVTDHLGSKKENFATAANLFQRVKGLLSENNLELTQVISCLMDNCNTMRGCRGGVETLIRKENPNLLDIHGDVVHIVHNAAKMFFQNFENFVDGFSSDVYYDIQDSPKAKQFFSEIQVLLNLKSSKQILRPVETRFLQMLTVCDRLHELRDAMIVYYYSFLSEEEQSESVVALINNIYKTLKVSDVQHKCINEIQSHLSKQKLTDASKARKERILLPLVHLHEKFSFFLEFYRGILLKFNSFIKMFQSEAPMMHRVHSEMFVLCKEFLSLFLKPEFLPKNSMKDLLAVDVKKTDIQLSDKYLSVGKFAYSKAVELRKKKVNWITSFYKKLRLAYISTAIYMMKNLPLNNKVLIWLSALSPKQRKCSTTLSSFDKLSDSLSQVISISDKSSLLEEVRKYTMDSDIAKLDALGVSDTSRIDYDWWAHIFDLREEDGVTIRYQHLGRLVKALLSVFSSPLVEGTFNIMDDIITDDRSCLTVENYEAVSIVKYNLRRKQIKAANLKHTPEMCSAIHAAHASYKKALIKRKAPTIQTNEKIDVPSLVTPDVKVQASTSDTTDVQASISNSDVQANTSNFIIQPSKKRPSSPVSLPFKKSKPVSAKITHYFCK